MRDPLRFPHSLPASTADASSIVIGRRGSSRIAPALYADLDAMFLGTLQAMVAAIDAKDPYTRGHSQRVAELSRDLAAAIGVPDEFVRTAHLSGLVHDIGKIGVPEAVLKKAGRLDDEEFAAIRQHPQIGHRILKDIPQIRDLLPGVLCHHEAWNGSGSGATSNSWKPKDWTRKVSPTFQEGMSAMPLTSAAVAAPERTLITVAKGTAAPLEIT